MAKLDIIDMIGLLPFLGVILLFFSIMVWGLIKDAIFRKKAVPVSAKVIEVEKAKNKAGEIIGYDITFEFEYNSKVVKETIFSLEKFKINSITTGLYKKGKKRSTLSVEGAGFHVDKPGIWLLGFPSLLFFTFVLTHEIFDISKKVVFDVIFIYFAYLFIMLYFIPQRNSKNKNKDQTTDIYNKVHYDEYSDVSSNLIRYIPKISKKRKKTSNFSSIMFRSIFIGLGSIGTLLGLIFTAYAVYITFTYPTVIGEISHIQTYTTVNSEGNRIKKLKVTHKYEIDGKEYTYIETNAAELYFKEVGDETKFYYNKNNPNDVVESKTLIIPFFMMLTGMLFVYVGINDIIEFRKNKRLYDAYVMLSKGDKE